MNKIPVRTLTSAQLTAEVETFIPRLANLNKAQTRYLALLRAELEKRAGEPLPTERFSSAPGERLLPLDYVPGSAAWLSSDCPGKRDWARAQAWRIDHGLARHLRPHDDTHPASLAIEARAMAPGIDWPAINRDDANALYGSPIKGPHVSSTDWPCNWEPGRPVHPVAIVRSKAGTSVVAARKLVNRQFRDYYPGEPWDFPGDRR